MKRTKIERKPINLVELRESFGLNQKLMAMYLRINVSTIKLVETGRRPLPTHALIRIANLEMKLATENKNPVFNTPHPIEHTYATIPGGKLQSLKARENKCRQEEKRVANVLDSMKSNYQKLRKRLQVIDTVIQENNGPETELQAWQMQKNIVANLLGKCGFPVQLLTEMKLKIIKNKISLYHKLELQLATTLPPLL
jgi:transcriptional regulator with XRE-family HTH domain